MSYPTTSDAGQQSRLMTLSPNPQFPTEGVYVLKLHRDAEPAQGRVSGRLVHMATGRSVDFADGGELLAQIQRDLARQPKPSGGKPS